VALIHDRKTLLVKYKDPEAHDGQSGWFLPDSSIKYLEHPDKAAHRLLKEQLGLQKILLVLDHIESFRGNDGSWHLGFHYKAHLEETPALETNEAIAAQRWANLILKKMKIDLDM